MNIFNVDKLDEALEQAAGDFASHRIRAWLLGNFRNHALRHGPSSRVLVLDRKAPTWARAAFAQNSLYELDVRASMEGLDEVLDYLRHLDAREKDFSRMSVPDAHRHQLAYHARLAKVKDVTAEEDGIETYLELDDGYRWVRVFGENSLKREGQMMGHCVGDYYRSVAAGRCVIYSLRDAQGRAHVTVEVDTRRREVTQIKGTANTLVVPKYHPRCLSLLASLKVANIDLDRSGLDPEATRQYVHAEGRGTLGGKQVLSLDVENRKFAERGAHPIEVLVYRNDSVIVEGSSMADVFENLGAAHNTRWFIMVRVPGLTMHMSLTYQAASEVSRQGAHLEFLWPNAGERKRKRLPGWKVYDRYRGFDVLYAALEAMQAQGLLCDSLPKTLLGRDSRSWPAEVREDVARYLRATLRRQELDGWTLYVGSAACLDQLAWFAELPLSGNAFLAPSGDNPDLSTAIWFTLGSSSMMFETIPALPPGSVQALAKVRGQRRVSVRSGATVKTLTRFLATLGVEPQGRAEATGLLTMLSVRRQTVLAVVDALNAGDTDVLVKVFPDTPMPKVWNASYHQVALLAARALYDNTFRIPVASALCALLSERPPLSDPRVRQGLVLIANGKTAVRNSRSKERFDSKFTALRAALPCMLSLTDDDWALFDAEGQRALCKLYKRKL